MQLRNLLPVRRTTISIVVVVLTGIGRAFKTGASPALRIPFGMFVFGIVLLYGAFLVEVKRSKRDFLTLLNGEEISLPAIR